MPVDSRILHSDKNKASRRMKPSKTHVYDQGVFGDLLSTERGIFVKSCNSLGFGKKQVFQEQGQRFML